MKKIAVFTDTYPQTKAFEAYVKEVMRERPGVMAHRSCRFFNPMQKEHFDAAVIDGDAINAEAIAETLIAWGVDAQITPQTELEVEAEKPLAEMSNKELEAKAESLGLKFPAVINTKAERVDYIETYLAQQGPGE